MASVHKKSSAPGKSGKKVRRFTEARGLPCIERMVSSVEETPEAVDAHVVGQIPEWVNGNFLRNGPGKFEIGNQRFNHWFDGMALLHQFKIASGQVTYKSRFLASDSYQSNTENNRITVSEFGTVTLPDPCRNFFQRFLSRFELPKPTDNANVSVVTYKGDYYVSTETKIIHKLDPEKLETTQKVDWSKFIAVNGATAHPHTEPDGTTYNMGNSYTSKGAYYNIIRVPAAKKREEETLEGATVLCTIPSSDKTKPSYYHSFAMTENYVVFVEQPIRMDLFKIVTGKLRGRSISDGFLWDPKRNTVFHLVDKRTGEVSSVKYLAKALSTFHQINAYEDDGFLVLDMCASDDGLAIANYNLQNLRKSGEALDEVYNTLCRVFPRRFVLPLHVDGATAYNQNLNARHSSTATAVRTGRNKVGETGGGGARPTALLSAGLLHPRGPPRRRPPPLRRPGVPSDPLPPLQRAALPLLLRLRLQTPGGRLADQDGRRQQEHEGDPPAGPPLRTTSPLLFFSSSSEVWEQAGFYPSEPVFVPAPNARAEDDGVVLSVVVTPDKERSAFLLVLDARSFQELGRAVVPATIPYGFHGTFSATA